MKMNLNADYVIPGPFDARVAPAVAAAVAKAAMETGVARMKVDPEEIKEKTRRLSIIGKSEIIDLSESILLVQKFI